MNSLSGGKGGRIPPPTRKLVIRKANSQRDLRPINERLSLDKVLGITTSSNAALACNPVDGIIAYPAGCIVVLFNLRRNKQDFIHNVSRKSITAVCFSKDGKFLATGESGHMPSVRVWNLEDPSHPQISEMKKGHKHGISCVAFSPNLKFLVSVGYQHDMLINVWNWRDGTTVACNKFSTKVYAISFSEIGNFFVTAGVRHVKFWYFDTESIKIKHDKTLPIKGRSSILGELQSHTFCDVACGLGDNSEYTYCVTTAGALCSFNAKRNLEKFVELGSSKALCMAVSEKYIICGYTNGFIRVFDPSSLQFVATLPKPHYLGVNVADGIDPSHMIAKTDKALYADTAALALDSKNQRLTCVYNDHSVYIWDLTDIKKVGKIWSSLYHSSCIWGLEMYPEISQPGYDKVIPLPSGTFLTCSNDDTVRVWNIMEGTNISSVKNIYSKELLRILYMDNTFANLKDPEISPTSKNMRDATSDGKGGVRTICTSPDGQHLAVGERSGNVRVYDCLFLDEILKIDAHESEVLCIEFSPPESGLKLLASAGRDRLIHIFDVNKEFTLIQTLDDHSASITSIKFNVDHENNDFQFLSCGADKSIIFRSAQYNPDVQFIRNTNYVGKTTLYDMAIDSSRNVAAIACQDRNVRVYDTSTGKQTKCYKGAQGDDGTLVKITMDNSGYYTASSCSDKTLSLHEFDTEECMATMSGHSEIVTGIRFTNDLKRLVTVSGDGCIFIWTIPTTYIQNMRERLGENGQELPKEVQPETPLRRGTYRIENTNVSIDDMNLKFGAPNSDFLSGRLELDPPVADFRFSIGQLPTWAKKRIVGEGGATPVSLPEQKAKAPSRPIGCWAQRINDGDLQVVSETSPQRPITLALDDGTSERKKFVIGYDPLQEQVDALANSPLERKCSLTIGEDDDLFPANGKIDLADLKEEDNESINAGSTPHGVRLSRGSEPFSRPESWNGDKLVFIETEEIQFEEAEESKEDEVKESIIYFPAAQDDMESETARSFQVTAAQKPKRRSVGDTEWIDKPEKEDDENKVPPDESSSDEDDDSLSAAVQEVKTDTQDKTVTSHKSENHDDVDDDDDDDDDDDEKCRKYFDCLGSTPTEEKAEEKPTPSLPNVTKVENTLPFLNGRLSISARFLSRSLLTRVSSTGQKSMDLLNEESDIEKAKTTSLEEHKLEIQKRKEEMARAVDANRKRLSALRKAKEERELKNGSPQGPTAVNISSSAEIIPMPSRRISWEAEVNPILRSPSLPSTGQSAGRVGAASDIIKTTEKITSVYHRPQNSSSEKTYSTNLFETCLSSVTLPQTDKDQLIPEKDENVWIKRNSSDSKREVSGESSTDSRNLLGNVKLPNKEIEVNKDIHMPKSNSSILLNNNENQNEIQKDDEKSKIKEDHVPKQIEVENIKVSSSETEQKNEKQKENKDEETKQRDQLGEPVKQRHIEKGNDKEKDRKLEREKKEKIKTDSSVVGKLEKRSSSSSLMAQTKSSWRKSLGFSGFSTRHKEKKDDRRGTFANTLRSSSEQPVKKSEKILFRERKGKVSAEDRKSKSKSLGDLDSRLKPVKEDLIFDPSVPPSHRSSTADITTELSNTKDPETPTASLPPFTDRRSPIGKDRDEKSSSKLQMYRDAVNQLNKALKSVDDLYSQVLEDDEDKEDILSLLTDTYSTVEEQCKRQKLHASQLFKQSNPVKPLNSSHSYSTSNIASLLPSQSTKMNRYASEACLPNATDEQEATSRDLLMRYSDILVEMVKQKLNN